MTGLVRANHLVVITPDFAVEHLLDGALEPAG